MIFRKFKLLEKYKEDGEESYHDSIYVNLYFEYVKDHWVYNKKTNKKVRKNLEAYGDIYVWSAKTDLAKCEEKRWKALQYYKRQFEKCNEINEKVIQAMHFCGIKMFCHYYKWYTFKVEKDSYYGQLIDTNNYNSPPISFEVNQDATDDYFSVHKRMDSLNKRFSYFNRFFIKCIENKYSNKFYQNRLQKKINLIINGRNYLIGLNDRNKFEIIAFPEDVIFENV